MPDKGNRDVLKISWFFRGYSISGLRYKVREMENSNIR